MSIRRGNPKLQRSMVMGLGVSGLALFLCVPIVALGRPDGNAIDTTMIQVKKVVKKVPPEKAVATVDKIKVEQASPSSNLLSILKNIPGFNVLSTGPGNLLTGDTAFTLNGFSSSQVGATFDGVPIINTFRGGIYGEGDDHAVTPITIGQISKVQVYSGANTPRQNSLNSLGGTINFSPRLPSDRAGVEVSLGGGAYVRNGDIFSGGIEANSGAIQSLGGFKALAKYGHTDSNGFQRHVYAHLNSYYLAAVQPFNGGLSNLSLIAVHNDEKAYRPTMVPLALVERYGRDYQYPTNVAHNIADSHATHVVLGVKSLLNPIAVGGLKFFYNDTENGRTAYANSIYNNSYMGYRLPTYLKSESALDGYGSNFNVYNSALATQKFGSAHAGTQYQRYIDNYHNVGEKSYVSLLLPSNTVTIGGMILQAKDHSMEGWYGSSPVPMIMGYNNAWLEHDGKDYWDGYVQDNMSLLGGRLHVYPGIKYVHISMYAADAPGYYYRHGGAAGKTFIYTEPSFGATFSPIKTVELYTNYGRIYKAPNISAIYSVIGSTPIPAPITVKPEYVDSIDAGIRYSGSIGKISLAAFDRRFNHIFSYSYSSVTGITTEYNSGAADYKGFTLAAEKPLFAHFLLEGNYGYTSAKYITTFKGNNGTVSSGMPRPNVPRYTANLALNYARGSLFGSLGSHFVGRQHIAYNGGVTSTTTLPAYATVDLSLTYTWRPHDGVFRKVKITGYGDNLLDEKHVVYAYVDGYQGGSKNYEQVQEGAPLFVGITLAALF